MYISTHDKQTQVGATGGLGGTRILSDEEIEEVAGGHEIISQTYQVVGTITQGDYQTTYYQVTNTYSDGSTYTFTIERTQRISRTI